MLCRCGCDNPDHDYYVPYSDYEISPPQGGKWHRQMDAYGGGARRRLAFDEEDEQYVPRSLRNPHDPRGSIYTRRALSPGARRLGPIRGIGRRPDLAAMTGLAVVRRRLDYNDVSDIEDEDEGGGCPAFAERSRLQYPPQTGYIPTRAPVESHHPPPPRQVRKVRPQPATRQQAPRLIRTTQGGGKCMRM